MPSIRNVNNVAPHTNISENHVQGLTSHNPLPHSINGNVVRARVVHVILGDGAHIVESEAIAEDVKVRDKLKILEERFRVVEGVGNYGLGNSAELCLVPNVVIPAKFQVLEFEKYRGATCPKSHLTMYCRKMAAHAHDDKMLIHFF